MNSVTVVGLDCLRQAAVDRNASEHCVPRPAPSGSERRQWPSTLGVPVDDRGR